MEQDFVSRLEKETEPNNIIAVLTEIINYISDKNSEKIDIEEITLKYLNSENDMLRLKATELAEHTKSEKVMEKIMYMVINDSNYFVRGFSVKALGSIGNIKSKEILEQALNDKEGFVTAFAAQALKTINVKLSFSSKLDALKLKLQTAKNN